MVSIVKYLTSYRGAIAVICDPRLCPTLSTSYEYEYIEVIILSFAHMKKQNKLLLLIMTD